MKCVGCGHCINVCQSSDTWSTLTAVLLTVKSFETQYWEICVIVKKTKNNNFKYRPKVGNSLCFPDDGMMESDPDINLLDPFVRVTQVKLNQIAQEQITNIGWMRHRTCLAGFLLVGLQLHFYQLRWVILAFGLRYVHVTTTPCFTVLCYIIVETTLLSPFSVWILNCTSYSNLKNNNNKALLSQEGVSPWLTCGNSVDFTLPVLSPYLWKTLKENQPLSLFHDTCLVPIENTP